MGHFTILVVSLTLFGLSAGQCPNGDPMYEYGLSEEEKTEFLDAHNRYRQMIMDGTVPGQPKGVNLQHLSYDEELAQQTNVVSNSCKMVHNMPEGTGQNLFMSMNGGYSAGANVSAAVEYWFNEYKLYVYPGGFSEETGHYTQVVWADTSKVGCGYVSFKESDDATYPYRKLYSCNYSPTGNLNNNPPYQTA